MQWLLCPCVSECKLVCVRVCVLHASVFPKELSRTAAAVSPYKDVCLWKEGWRKKENEEEGHIWGKRKRKWTDGRKDRWDTSRNESTGGGGVIKVGRIRWREGIKGIGRKKRSWKTKKKWVRTKKRKRAGMQQRKERMSRKGKTGRLKRS